MSYISIGGLTPPLDSIVVSFSQSYADIERSSLHRLGVSGRGVKQTLYGNKLKTTIQAAGWTTSGLSGLDRSIEHELLCGAPLGVIGGVSDIVVGQLSRRRTDPGFEPVGYALFDDHQAETPVTVDAAGNCQLTPVAGALGYKVNWYPRLTVLVVSFEETVQTEQAQYIWQLAVEEV